MDQEYYTDQSNQARCQNPRQTPLTPYTVQQGWEVLDSKLYSRDEAPHAAMLRPILRRQNATVNIPVEDSWQTRTGHSIYSFVSLTGGSGGRSATAFSQDDLGYPWQPRRNMDGASMRSPHQIKSLNGVGLDKDLALSTSEPNGMARVMIGGSMSISDITQHLADHRCKDVAPYLDLSSCGEAPVSWGGFGDIYCGRLLDGTRVAIKCARFSIGSDAVSRKILKRSAHELYVWSKYQHPNLLELFGFAQFRGQIAMVSPWMENGNLSEYISRNPGVDRCRLCVQVCEGVAYLHSTKTAHGDLKAANVLVSREGVAKITDFGNTRLQEYTLSFAPTSKGLDCTLRWTAPELVSEQSCLPSCESDVYALGMTILEVITGQVPYAGLNDRAVMVAVACRKQKPPRPDIFIPYESSIGDILWRMLESCWDPDPKNRAKASSIRDIMAEVTHEGLTRRDSYIFVD